MVQAYFEDMAVVAAGLNHQVRDGGVLAIDIGNSNYGGINVATHENSRRAHGGRRQ